MKKHIGTKIISMFLALIIIIEVINITNLMIAKEAKSNIDTLSDVYMEIEAKRVDLVYRVDNIKNFSNLIALLPIPEATEGMVGEAPDLIEEYDSSVEEITRLCKKTGNKELIESFQSYVSTTDPMKEVLTSIVDSYSKNGQSEQILGTALSLNGMLQSIEDAENNFDEALNQGMEECQKSTNAVIRKMEYLSIFSMIIILVIFVLMVVVVLKSVSGPAKSAGMQLVSIMEKIDQKNGDLTERITVQSEDEIGQLVSGVNHFIEQLQTIMKKIQLDSRMMQESVEEIQQGVYSSNESAVSVSEVMEHLSAGMEEVSATVSHINGNSQKVLQEAKEMAISANQGSQFVSEIRERASTIREETILSKDKTEEIVNGIKVVLERSIEESKSVERIHELTEEILDISGQTNLLALNASIEAARAGEAGKGFAVVADEISNLANNSRDTANNIQNISKMVTDAVSNLAANANDMIQFVNDTVLKDYESFVSVAERYRSDANDMDHILQGFSESSKELALTMEDMTNGLDEIALSVEDSAKGVIGATENTGQLVDATKGILKVANNNLQIAAELNEEVNKFRNI